MPPEPRLLGFGAHLPDVEVPNERLAPLLERQADEIARDTGIARRYNARPGEGPSDLALRAATDALAAASTEPREIGLIVFATTTPDVCFPGAACFLQDKLGAPTVGALDVRAQTGGFLCALDLALSFCDLPGPSGADPRYARVLVAAGEVMSSGLDESPRGADLTPRFGDGAGAVVVGRADSGPRVLALRWYVDGTLADRFWCEYPASRRYPMRVTADDLAAGKHYPNADLPALAPIVRARLAETAVEVLGECGWPAKTVDCVLAEYVEPRVARAVVDDLDLRGATVVIPTEQFGHVMAGGLLISLAQRRATLAAGARLLLLAAGPGVCWGAAALEL